jgi:precorrin-6B methylase 2
MALDEVRALVAKLSASAEALHALGAALDAQASGMALDGKLEPQVDEVLMALGVKDSLNNVNPAELRTLLAQIRVFSLTSSKLLFAASRGAGWNHLEPEMLESAGDASAGFPARLRAVIAPQLEGLAEKLDAPGSWFLDVGVGVGAVAIEMARTWPKLSVVGIDLLPQALAIAHARVRAAGLEARIQLREQTGQDLPDQDAFELAWLPSIFVPQHVTPEIVTRLHRALRAGGWLLVPVMKPNDDPLATSLSRLRTAMFGGWVATPLEVEALLRSKGFADVRALPSPLMAVTGLVVGRRGS